MNSQLSELQTRVEQILNGALASRNTPQRLQDAMRYSTLGGGKRVRALLAYAAGTALNAPLERVDAVAAALECIHSYSLIHDDLPAMDDDDLRRGKASNHVKYDEATAILAGDALLTLAFELINADESSLNNQQARKITLELAQQAGRVGMVGGQTLDILATDQDVALADLEDIHRRKTGALIQAAVICGAQCGDHVSDQQLSALKKYASALGLAFQVVDDILDVESSTGILGKTSGADIAMGKSTYPAILGLEESKQLAQKLYHQAIASVDSISDNSELLKELAQLVVKRNK